MHERKLLPIIVAVLVLAGVFFSGVTFGRSSLSGESLGGDVINSELGAPEQVDFAPFWRAWNEIDKRFVPAGDDIVGPEARVWGAIEGLARSLEDPYTVFLPPQEAERFAEDIQGNFGGVGIEIGVRDSVLTVIAPLKDTPADRAGIRAGDHIVGINGEPSTNLTIDEAIERIRGPVGESVTLTLLREGVDDPIDVRVTRAEIQIPTIDTELRPDGIFIIRLYNFSANAPSLFRRALREFVLSGSNRLIVDLRGNPGGFLEAAIDTSSWFLPPGTIVLRETFGEGEEERIHRSRGYNIFGPDLDMVILVDGGSASASEIFAGALQEHDVATLVGSQTFGKGSVQELIPITPDTSLKLTIARWLTPKGQSISDGGLTPDVEVDMTLEDFEAGRDPQLDQAVALLTQNK